MWPFLNQSHLFFKSLWINCEYQISSSVSYGWYNLYYRGFFFFRYSLMIFPNVLSDTSSVLFIRYPFPFLCHSNRFRHKSLNNSWVLSILTRFQWTNAQDVFFCTQNLVRNDKRMWLVTLIAIKENFHLFLNKLHFVSLWESFQTLPEES